MDKDQVLNRIIEVESQLETNKVVHNELQAKAKELETVERGHRKVYDEIRAQLDLVADILRQASNNLSDTKADLRINNESRRSWQDELASLRRELSRIQDNERIKAAYNEQIEAFKEASLLSSWRKENREDGIGAFDYQIEGAIHLAVAKQGLLGDKRGLGKSLTSLIWADLIGASKVIFICPSDTMDNFIREIKLWTPHRHIIKLGKMSRAQRDFVLGPLKSVPEFSLIINYEAWRKDAELVNDLIALQADTLIYDEAQRAMTATTSVSKGILALRFGLNICPECSPEGLSKPGLVTVDWKNEKVSSPVDKNYATCHACGYGAFITDFCSIKHVLPMTGTPIVNKPQELFPHVRAIDPKNFIDEKNYLRDFCQKGYDGRWHWQYKGEDRLVQIIGSRYVARDRKAAGVIIPPAQPIDHIISHDEFEEKYPKQFKAYEQVRKYAQLVLDPDQGITMAMMYTIVVLNRLRQVMAWPAGIVLKRKDDNGIEYDYARLNVYESVKVDKAEELIKEITEEGEASLAFSMFKDPLYELEKRLGKRALAYTGDTPTYLKNEAQLDFDPKTAPLNPKWDTLLGTYKAMGVGLNLNRATHEILLDRAWNPAGEEQAEGRIDRLGTTRDTYIHRIIVENTIDSWMKSLIETKADIIKGFADKAALYDEMYRALKEGEI
jgi:SNF2 family DNA or RNA helicase